MKVTWVLEASVFASGDERLVAAIEAAGDRLVRWQDDWWSTGRWPRLDGPVVVRAALANADRIARELPWQPGAFCDTAAFCCSRWYDAAAPWLLNRRFVMTTARALADDAAKVLAPIRTPERVFVRPDSPLKPFAGRVIATAGLTLRALDHGFYYDDEHLPVVAAPVVPVDAEWRYVVVDGKVVAGSAYQADGRSALPDDPRGEPWQLAQTIAATMPAPQRVYVLDLCRSEGELRLLELNPFSGADLYASDAAAIVAAVDAVARSLA